MHSLQQLGIGTGLREIELATITFKSYLASLGLVVQRQGPPTQVTAADVEGDAPDPGAQCTVEAKLVQLTVHAQERLLAQVARVLVVGNHAVQQMPDQLLIAFNQRAERPWRPQARHPNPAEQFGLGWHVVELEGEVALWHDRRESGVRSLVVLLPLGGDGLVLLTNSDNGELMVRALIAGHLTQGEAINEALDRQVWT